MCGASDSQETKTKCMEVKITNKSRKQREKEGENWCSKSASARFTDVVIKDIVPTGSYEFDLLLIMIRWKV